MSENGLAQPELDELTAWMDGELAGTDARRIAELVRADPRWRKSHREFLAVTEALAGMPAPAAGPGLAERIVRRAHRERVTSRIWRVAAPLAAAAAVIVAVTLWNGRPAPTDVSPPVAGTPIEKVINDTLKDIPQDDRFIVANLPLFQNYTQVQEYQEVSALADAETMAALRDLETSN